MYFYHTLKANLKKFKFFQLDLNNNLNEITKLIIDNKIPYIVNLQPEYGC